MYKVKDIKLASEGVLKVEWAENNMPVLDQIKKEMIKRKPFKGLTIACCLHVTKETAVLMNVLRAGGARVGLCGSNPLSTQNDTAAAIARDGIDVYAWYGVSDKEYYWCLNKVLDMKPNITIDDGADLVATIHSKRPELLKGIIGGTEETTTGVIRFKAMAADGALKYPIMAVNDSRTKFMFDNRYGTGQSSIDGILRATNVLIAGKNFVVSGYGWCGRGVATRADGEGANVIVCEVDPVKALEAGMDGFRVMPIVEAAKIGDIFITATGDISVIDAPHFKLMKDGAIVCNTGHFNVELNLKALGKMMKKKRKIRDDLEEYTLKTGRRIFVLAEGRLVNLAAAEGHPSEVMDMSFANQALAAEYLVTQRGKMNAEVYRLPELIDEKIASLKLASMGIKIDKLTPQQKKYLSSWQEGT